MSICLEYVGPHPLDRLVDPNSDDYIVAMSDMSAPVGIHFAATPTPRRHHRPNPPSPAPAVPIRLRPSAQPPLPPWPANDAPGFSTAKALQAIQWIIRGYPKAEIARALHLNRATISNFSTGRIWRHVPWPPGHQPVQRGTRRSPRVPSETLPQGTGRKRTGRASRTPPAAAGASGDKSCDPRRPEPHRGES